MPSKTENTVGMPSFEEEVQQLLKDTVAGKYTAEESLAKMEELVEKHKKPVQRRRRSSVNSSNSSPCNDSGPSGCGSSGCSQR